MKRVLFALVGLAALTGTAAAADLAPRLSPAPYYKAPVAIPVYNWTGFYIGINGGGGFRRSQWDKIRRVKPSRGLGWRTTDCPLGCKTSDHWLSTVRGRLGYAADRFMPFVTGGAAFGDIRASTPGFAGGNNTNAGWTVGAGLEFAIAGNWTAKAEYLYVDLGKFNCGISCGAAVTDNVSFTP